MTPSEKVALFREAAKLIKDVGWTRGYYAKDKNEKDTDPWKENATCFCSMGAILKVAADKHPAWNPTSGHPYSDIPNEVWDVAREEFERLGVISIPDWNDTIAADKDTVLATFEEIITKLEAEAV